MRVGRYLSQLGEEDSVSWSQVATLVTALFLPQILAFGLNAVLPIRPDQAELVHAGSGIIGLFTALFIWISFGRTENPLPAARRMERNLRDSSPRPSDVLAAAVPRAEPQIQEILRRISRHDPGFSEVDLHQWLRHLAPVALRADPKAASERLRPFLHTNAWQTLVQSLDGAEDVQVGRVVIRRADHGTWDDLQLDVGLRSLKDGVWRPTRQDWTLRRSTSARSLPLPQMLTLDCPACGSPVQLGPPEWACSACDRRISEGQLHWQVREITPKPGRMRSTEWQPLQDGEPHPSLLVELDSPRVAAQLRSLAGRHPELDLMALDQHIRQIAVAYAEYESFPGMEETQAWRRERLSAQGIQRVGERAEVVSTELIAAEQDGWYERIDARVVLRGTVALFDAEGRLLHGHPDFPHEWALCVRLAAPSKESCRASQFTCWQALSPREYLA